ncbi:MAG: hypothetical protein E6G49_10260 [Actinobacteria bacterium]|nr:MAG: hypothetical protein E6G49_10260 [Actinomycetota bacterium]
MLVASAVSWLMAAGAQAAESPAQKLVDAYSPIVMLREQTEDPPCDSSEEQYEPTTVDTVLGNPRVQLVPPGKDAAVTTAPTAAEIAGLGGGYHLNLPGDPLHPGCNYAKDFAALKEQGNAPAITYARIATEDGESGLAVQYWFFYYFNQFNDLHEGDWEGMQIAFDANTPREALAEGPSEIALFQHEGGEKGSWDDPKVEKELSSRRLPRHLLRPGGLCRERERRVRPRVRQHHRAASAGGAQACPRANQPASRRPVQVADVQRPLGPEGEGLRQRSPGPDGQAAMG